MCLLYGNLNFKPLPDLRGHQQKQEHVDSIRVRKYKLISRKQVGLAIEKEDQMSKVRFLKQLRRRLPVKFEDFANQGLILKRLFCEDKLPSRIRLGLCLKRYKILRVLHIRH